MQFLKALRYRLRDASGAQPEELHKIFVTDMRVLELIASDLPLAKKVWYCTAAFYKL